MAVMADLAAVFHWPPSEMRKMALGELKQWHALARERAGVIR